MGGQGGRWVLGAALFNEQALTKQGQLPREEGRAQQEETSAVPCRKKLRQEAGGHDVD